MVKNSYEITTKLRHRERTFRSVGGLSSKDRIAKSTRLLIDNVNANPGDIILDYGCGYGAVGVALADSAPGVDIRMVDSDIRAVRWAQENVRANGIENAHIVLDHTLDRYSDGFFNIIAMNPPIEEGTEAIFEMIDRALPKLRNGGSFYLIAKVRKGAKSYMRKLTETIGPAKVIRKSGGYWLMRAERSPVRSPVPADLSAYEHTVETRLRGRKYTFCTRAGIFSRKEIDDGTLLLIESVDVMPMNSVIDVGCGYGPIGIAAAHLASVGRVVSSSSSRPEERQAQGGSRSQRPLRRRSRRALRPRHLQSALPRRRRRALSTGRPGLRSPEVSRQDVPGSHALRRHQASYRKGLRELHYRR